MRLSNIITNKLFVTFCAVLLIYSTNYSQLITRKYLNIKLLSYSWWSRNSSSIYRYRVNPCNHNVQLLPLTYVVYTCRLFKFLRLIWQITLDLKKNLSHYLANDFIRRIVVSDESVSGDWKTGVWRWTNLKISFCPQNVVEITYTSWNSTSYAIISVYTIFFLPRKQLYFFEILICVNKII